MRAPTNAQMSPALADSIRAAGGIDREQMTPAEQQQLAQSGWVYGDPAPPNFRYDETGLLQHVRPSGWERAAQYGALAVPIVATVATGGAASPWAMAALSGASGAYSTGVGGGSNADMWRAGLTGAATGGLGSGIAQSGLNTGQQVGAQAALGAGSGAVSGGSKGALLGGLTGAGGAAAGQLAGYQAAQGASKTQQLMTQAGIQAALGGATGGTPGALVGAGQGALNNALYQKRFQQYQQQQQQKQRTL
jgi:hypothetical protein